MSLSQGRTQLLTPWLALPAAMGSCLASGGTPKARLGLLVLGPALELGSVRAGQTQTSPERAGRRESERQVGSGWP